MTSMPTLPSNCRINKGYLEARVYYHGRRYLKHFGKDCKEARIAAKGWIQSLEETIRLNKLGVQEPLKRLPFSQAADLFFKFWYEQELSRSHRSKLNAESFCRSLKDYFKDRSLDTFTVELIQQWRHDRQAAGVKFNSVNREQGFLSSMFEKFNYWNKLGLSAPVKPVKLPYPYHNPVVLVKKPSEQSANRTRVCSMDELKHIKAACIEFHDEALWQAIRKAIHTMLRQKDLISVEVGQSIKLYQSKTGKPIIIPVVMTEKINSTNLRKRWDRVRAAAGCSDLQWRDLRRSGANLLRELGYSQELIKDALGHQKQATTDIYTNVKSVRLKPALDEVGKMLDSL